MTHYQFERVEQLIQEYFKDVSFQISLPRNAEYVTGEITGFVSGSSDKGPYYVTVDVDNFIVTNVKAIY